MLYVNVNLFAVVFEFLIRNVKKIGMTNKKEEHVCIIDN